MPVKRRTPVKQARAEMNAHLHRMNRLACQTSFLGHLADLSNVLVPAERPGSWPTDIQELSDKISRQSDCKLRPGELPVRNRDRQMVIAGLPPGVAVEMNDPRLDTPRRHGDPVYC